MAYQNISNCRIYLNIPEYLASVGTTIDPVFRTLPVGVNNYANADGITIEIPDGLLGEQCFVAILGHTLNTDSTDYDVTETATLAPVINGTPKSGDNGFSISTFDATGETSLTVTGISGKMTICTGIYYDFPHSPDLNLSLSYEYGGIKETTTKGGATLTNAFYTKPPAWGNLGAWELGGEPKYAKSGRRVWDLSFSYLNDSSVFPDNAGLANETDDDNLTLLEDDTFQRVITLTQGGQLPFLFQSDNTVDATSPKPDQLAIAKFDMNTFQFKQVANGVYSVKVKIREVW